MTAALVIDRPGGVPPGAPCLDGHFPGAPVVPGAWLLAETAEALSRRGIAIGAMPRAKFAAPLRPGEGYRIEIGALAGRSRIRILSGATLLAELVAELVPASHG